MLTNQCRQRLAYLTARIDDKVDGFQSTAQGMPMTPDDQQYLLDLSAELSRCRREGLECHWSDRLSHEGEPFGKAGRPAGRALYRGNAVE